MRSAFTFILRRELYHPRRMWKWYRVYPIEIIGCYCFLHKSPLLYSYRYPIVFPCIVADTGGLFAKLPNDSFAFAVVGIGKAHRKGALVEADGEG